MFSSQKSKEAFLTYAWVAMAILTITTPLLI